LQFNPLRDFESSRANRLPEWSCHSVLLLLFESWPQTSFSVVREQVMDRREFYEQTKDRRIRSSSRYYQKLLRNLFAFLVPPQLRVLELGCGTGDLLAALKPKRAVGVDFSAPLVDVAKQRHPHLEFQMAEAAEFQSDEKFDYIVLSDLINDLPDVQKLFEQGDPKAIEIKERVDTLFYELVEQQLVRAQSVYRYFPAQADGNTIVVYDPHERSRVLERFTFPRQPGGKYLCLADFVRPVASGEMDSVALFVVTCGLGVRELATAYKDAGAYVRSHAIQALAIELAEAYAEKLHQDLRAWWGFPDPPEMTRRDRFQAKYSGLRVPLGYPACPDLEDQTKLFALLRPEDIGVQLTEGWMMDPEASVSALVFHHPEAEYFRADRA